MKQFFNIFLNNRFAAGISLVMLKLKIHPAFFLYAVALVLQGEYIALSATVLAALFHECGHAAAAYSRGYTLDTVTLMPYGAVLHGGEKIAQSDSFFIALAGPLVSAALALFTAALWWLRPESYFYTKAFGMANWSIAVFNLLPAYPLDGARMILSGSKSPVKTLKIFRIIGIIVAFLFAAWFIVSVFFKINYSLGFMAVMLYLSATGGTKEESYRHIAADSLYVKDYSQAIVQKTLYISKDLKLIDVLKHVKKNALTTFLVTDGRIKVIRTLSEEEFGKLCLKYPLRTTLKHCMPQEKINADTAKLP